MPIFYPFSSKSKVGQPKKKASNKDEMSYKSNEEELLTHLGNLQLEVSRLHHQLASIQSQHHHQARAKEEISTQRSHQTFSTIGTTQPNLSSGSNTRPTSRQGPSPRFHDRHQPDCDYSSRDRPPPVTQIFIPTPSIPYQASGSYTNHSEYYDNQSMQDSAVWMDEVRISSLRHYQSTDNNLGNHYDGVPRYIRTGGIPSEWAPKQRNHTGSEWQKHHLTSNSTGPTGITSMDRIRVRTVKRIPTENGSATHSSNTRRSPTLKNDLDQPIPLDEKGQYTFGGYIYVPKRVHRVHKYDEGDQALLSNNKRQHRLIGPSTEISLEHSQFSSHDNVCQGQGRHVKKYLGEELQFQQPCQKSRYRIRESLNSQSNHKCYEISLESSTQERSRPFPRSAKCILPALSSSTNNGNHHDKNLLLSQIRKQRFHLKPVSDRPEKPPLPKDKVGMMFEAIQHGVTLKHVETPFKSSYHQNKTQQNSMLLQLQERKKAFTQYEGSSSVPDGSHGV